VFITVKLVAKLSNKQVNSKQASRREIGFNVAGEEAELVPEELVPEAAATGREIRFVSFLEASDTIRVKDWDAVGSEAWKTLHGCRNRWKFNDLMEDTLSASLRTGDGLAVDIDLE